MNRVIYSADWPYRWLSEPAEPPDRTLWAAWSVLLGICLAILLLTGLMLLR